MTESDSKKKITELSEFITANQPYVIDIDICKQEGPKHNYWEVGMKTLYKGKAVEILSCINTTEYSKVISNIGDEFEVEHRSICSLLIRDVK